MGRIEGVDSAVGTILGMLFGAYGGGMNEKRRRAELEERQKELGVQPSLPEESSYLERLLNPGAGQQELPRRMNIMELLAAERRKEEAAIREYRREQGGRMEVEGARGKSKMESDRYGRETPQAQDPSQVDFNKARAEKARQDVNESKTFTDMLRGRVSGSGGSADAPGGTASGGGGGPLGLGEGESISRGGFTFTGRMTQAQKEANIGREERIRQGSKPLTGTAADALTAMDLVTESIDELDTAAKDQYFGLKGSWAQLREATGNMSAEESDFRTTLGGAALKTTGALRLAPVSDTDIARVEKLYGSLEGSLAWITKPNFRARLQAIERIAHSIIRSSIRTATTPRSELSPASGLPAGPTGGKYNQGAIDKAIEAFEKAKRGK